MGYVLCVDPVCVACARLGLVLAHCEGSVWWVATGPVRLSVLMRDCMHGTSGMFLVPLLFAGILDDRTCNSVAEKSSQGSLGVVDY